MGNYEETRVIITVSEKEHQVLTVGEIVDESFDYDFHGKCGTHEEYGYRLNEAYIISNNKERKLNLKKISAELYRNIETYVAEKVL